MGAKQHLTVPGRYDQIRTICDFVAEGAEQAGLDDDAVFGVQLACDEACTNVIEHAYGDENVGEISVSWQVRGNKFKIIIQDRGQPFDPDLVESPAIPADPHKIEELKIGGLGIHFMRQMMDEINFTFDEHKGNTLIMVKRLSDNSAP